LLKFLRDVSDDARGSILRNKLEKTLINIRTADSRVVDRVELEFAALVAEVFPKLHNMSAEGRTKFGRTLQADGGRTYDLDIGRGTALWLLGAWLEATNLTTAEGVYVRDTIFRLLDSIDIVKAQDVFNRL
jgi:hypothetical protein